MKINRFEPVPNDNIIFHCGDEICCDINDDAIWGFALSKHSFVIGNYNLVSEFIARALKDRMLENYPFLKLDASKFCERGRVNLSLALDAYNYMYKSFRRSALNWRNNTVILPFLRQDLMEWGKSIGVSGLIDFRNIYVSGDEKNVRIDLQLGTAIENFNAVNREEILLRTFSALDKFQIQNVECDYGSGRKTRKRNQEEFYGVVFPIDGVGRNVILRFPRWEKHIGVFYPFLPPKNSSNLHLIEGASVIFSVFGDRTSNYKEAISSIRSYEHDDRIKVAVVSAPISFGDDYRNPYSLSNLNALKEIFDYIIIIGSHLMNRSGNSYRSLTVSKNASRSAKNAIQAFVDLMGTMDSPFSPDIFKSKFDTSGFVLFGRSHTASRVCENKIRSMKLSLINVHANFDSSSQKAILSGSQLLSDKFFRTDMFRSNSFVISSRFPKSSLRCVAFGVRGNLIGDEVAFYESIYKMIRFHNIKIYRASKIYRSVYIRSMHKDVRIHTLCSSSIDGLDIKSLARAACNLKVIIVTRFSAKIYSEIILKNPTIEVMHYADFGAWLGELEEQM
jgi:hypothetical protein